MTWIVAYLIVGAFIVGIGWDLNREKREAALSRVSRRSLSETTFRNVSWVIQFAVAAWQVATWPYQAVRQLRP